MRWKLILTVLTILIIILDYSKVMRHFQISPMVVKRQASVVNSPCPIVPVKLENEYAGMPKYEIKLSIEVQKYLWNCCKVNDWSYDIVLSQLKVESDFDFTLRHCNPNGTTDLGMAQINSSSLRWYGNELAGIEEFDPMNPYHSVDACIAGLNFYRNYWKSKGVVGSETLLRYVLNSYNMGIGSFKKYIKNSGSTSRCYDRVIISRASELRSKGRFID